MHPSSLNQLFHAHVQCREPKKVSMQKVPTLKRTSELYPSWCFYSMGVAVVWHKNCSPLENPIFHGRWVFYMQWDAMQLDFSLY